MKSDATSLRPLRRGEGLIRGRFAIEHNGSTYVVDSLYLDLDERIRLYRDGRVIDSGRRRVKFRLDDGAQIEAAVSQVGMKYVRIRKEGADGPTQLTPVDGTAEAWRARIDAEHPTASRAAGWVSLTVLLLVLAIELPQLINLIGDLTPLIGWPTFEVPALNLTGWANAALILLAGAAGLERSLSLRYHPLLDD